MHAADTARPPAHTVVVLGLITMFAPLSLDLYLPHSPACRRPERATLLI
jgi:hypothetical protein